MRPRTVGSTLASLIRLISMLMPAGSGERTLALWGRTFLLFLALGLSGSAGSAVAQGEAIQHPAAPPAAAPWTVSDWRTRLRRRAPLEAPHRGTCRSSARGRGFCPRDSRLFRRDPL